MKKLHAVIPWSTWVAFDIEGGIGGLGCGILKYDGFVASLLVAMRFCDALDEAHMGAVLDRVAMPRLKSRHSYNQTE